MSARADDVPRRARAYAYGFLGAFVVCGLFAIEAWPLTGWRLFSAARTERQVGWEVTAVDPAGAESPLPFARFGVAYRGDTQILQGFERLSARDRAAVCDAWAREAERLGVRVAALRVWRVERHLARRAGARAAPGTRTLVHTCAR